MKKLLSIALLVLACGLVAAEDAPATLEVEAPAEAPETCALDDLELEATARGGNGKPGGGDACCDPALEPGGGVVPFCFEGHTCCANGNWNCNNPDASPSCDAGTVCDTGCASSGASCSTASDCCSGNCKKNGVCR